MSSMQTLAQALEKRVPEEDLRLVIEAIFESATEISEKIRTASVSPVGATNLFGDEQLAIDIICDHVLFKRLRNCPSVYGASSEEQPELLPLGGSGYVVSFDPLDGSSIVDVNWTVGTIFGIWPGDSFLGRTPRDQVVSGMVMYGPRTTMAIALPDGAHEFTLHGTTWLLNRPDLRIKPSGKLFAPGNLRATADHPKYRELVEFWRSNKYTLRYTGGMVPDVYQLLIKGGGVFCNPSSPSAPAKLRVLYEVGPLAKLVEAAGGSSSDGSQSILDVQVESYEQKSQVCLGSKEEVERFNSYLAQ
eukprot:GILK01001303.1.p1 GENE.GILK01001303.1~~GILK01001303.1.p1  ORF type:complete len:303 (-),score=48.72 GILK01001303.1:109-1017(-)